MNSTNYEVQLYAFLFILTLNIFLLVRTERNALKHYTLSFWVYQIFEDKTKSEIEMC
jgi:hypothetical protein